MRIFWLHVKRAFAVSLSFIMMYLSASMLLLVTSFRKDAGWSAKTGAWSLTAFIIGVGFNVAAAWAFGRKDYETLRVGNRKRLTQAQYGEKYQMTKHDIQAEFRVWKGFAFGAVTAIFPIVTAIFFGCNQAKIDAVATSENSATLAWCYVFYVFSGWSVLPFVYLNVSGYGINYFATLVVGIIPILVSGFVYMAAGLKEKKEDFLKEELARQKTQEKTKKVNYGGLPGTKPKKKK